jgi:hypothetical protein
MKKMDKEGIEIYREIKKLKSVSKDEVLMMEQFTKNYIDPKCKICSNCSAQIRFAYNRIINWGDKMKIEELTFDEWVEIKQDETPEPSITPLLSDVVKTPIPTPTTKKRSVKK